MKSYITFLICTFFLYLPVLNAQAIEVKLVDGTSLKGIVKYSGWVKTPAEIEIKSDKETAIYKPSQILGFDIEGDRYLSKTVDLNITKQDIQNLSDFKELKSVRKQVFLKVIVQGNANLYTYKDNRTHYFVEKGGEIIELIRLIRSTRSPFNKYVGQLNILLSDCQKLSKNENVQFNKTNLKRTIIAYNKCQSGESSFIEKKHPIQFSLYAIGGYKLTSYGIDNGGFYGNYQIENESNGAPAYGIGFDFDILQRTKKLQFYAEFLLQNYKFEAFYRDQRLPEQYIDYFLDVDVSYLEINGLVRYNFGNDLNGARVFVNAGVNEAVQVSDKSTEYANSVFFGTENRIEREPLNGDIVTNRITFLLGAGLRYKFVSGEIRYGFNPRFSDFPTISRTDNLNFLLAFKVL
ncbi:hypothetical protein [Allomuricauda sp. R78024]|uniref:hypothetical protein n=1 Tax=Allomuricauda sp. R78024 TaxID=3093867 RepID=UPI0037C885A9